jgi:hypothetical protein
MEVICRCIDDGIFCANVPGMTYFKTPVQKAEEAYLFHRDGMCVSFDRYDGRYDN